MSYTQLKMNKRWNEIIACFTLLFDGLMEPAAICFVPITGRDYAGELELER